MYLRTASVIEELFTALAYVDANDMVFVDISVGHCSKAEALWTHTKFELRSLQQLLFIFHDTIGFLHDETWVSDMR